MFSSNVKWGPAPQSLTGAQSLATPKTYTINCEGQTMLMLDIDYVHAAATALVFTFTGDSVLSGNQYKLVGVNYAGSSSTAGVFTVTLPVTANDNFKIPFSLTGIGLTGNIQVTITAATTPGGTVNVQPYVAAVGA